ncbi:MAG: ABC transporter permease [Rhizobiaceae bacterium]
MVDITKPHRATSRMPFTIPAKHRGLMAIVVIFLLALVTVNALSPSPMSYFDVNSLASGGAPLALAAIGQTIIIIGGGFDLSAGATISLVNVIVASLPQDTLSAQLLSALVGLAVGALVGAFNGFFVAYFRLQSIVVTLSTMFLVKGITLLIMKDPGGYVGPELTSLLAGSAIPGFLPSSLVVVAIALLVWLFLKGTRWGTALYAVGSDQEAARSAGLSVAWTRFWAFTLGGMFYGASGVLISAQIGAADPLIGDPILLQTFTAVVLGGTALAGGRGGALGTVLGAYTLMIMVNILLSLDVSAYYSTVAEGVVLVIAALAGVLGAKAPLREYLGILRRRFESHRSRTGARFVSSGLQPRSTPAKEGGWTVSWTKRHADLLRIVLPAFIAFALVVVLTQFVHGGSTIFSWKYYNSLMVLGTFLAILALGQGTVILSGGLDLSIPWTICFCGILAAGMINGSDAASIYVIPLVLVVGALIGAVNGFGVAILGLPPIVITLAMNGILQGAALVYSDGTPAGFSSPGLRWLMTGKVLGFTPVVLFTILFVLIAIGLLGRTVFSRWVYALGNSPRASFLAGVNVRRTTIAVYMLSGFCSALVGILLTGFGGQASLGMGDTYLLPSIAVVIIGGTLITGGRGHYVGMLGGVLLLTSLQTLLAGTTLPFASRDIIFGLVVLGAVLALREKSSA